MTLAKTGQIGARARFYGTETKKFSYGVRFGPEPAGLVLRASVYGRFKISICDWSTSTRLPKPKLVG